MTLAPNISLRLTIWFSSILLIGLVFFGAAMWADLDHTLTASRSKTLTRRAERLSRLLQDAETLYSEERARNYRVFANATGGGLIEVFRPDGSLAYPSPSDEASRFPWPTDRVADGSKFSEVDFEGQPYRVLTVRFSSMSRRLVLCLAAPLAGNRQVLSTFSSGLLWAIPAVLILSALGGYLLSRKALSPVDRINAAVRTISVTNLSARLPVSKAEDELRRLSETCNLMLARLESAVKELKQFTADASHELRSPLSFIRTASEVALRNRKADPESRLAFEQIIEECAGASRLLGDMLLLARADAGNCGLVFERVDLVDVLAGVCERAQLLLRERNQRLEFVSDEVSGVPISGDYASLHRLLWSLIENAVKYTPSSGLIQVELEVTAQTASVKIKDTGVGIRKADLPHIFQRFYRADASRGQVEGFGLGLSIAQWIAAAHHASISVESEEDMGSVFAVTFPILGKSASSPLTFNSLGLPACS